MLLKSRGTAGDKLVRSCM